MDLQFLYCGIAPFTRGVLHSHLGQKRTPRITLGVPEGAPEANVRTAVADRLEGVIRLQGSGAMGPSRSIKQYGLHRTVGLIRDYSKHLKSQAFSTLIVSPSMDEKFIKKCCQVVP